MKTVCTVLNVDFKRLTKGDNASRPLSCEFLFIHIRIILDKRKCQTAHLFIDINVFYNILFCFHVCGVYRYYFVFLKFIRY